MPIYFITTGTRIWDMIESLIFDGLFSTSSFYVACTKKKKLKESRYILVWITQLSGLWLFVNGKTYIL